MIYLIISGNSMEPGFSRGDLALARAAEHYEVGDIVVYEHPSIGQVFHRIVGFSEGHYKLQGDNNYWVDAYHPTQSEIGGRYLLRIPQLGKALSSLRAPENLAYFSVGASALLLASVVTGREEKTLRQKQRSRQKETASKVPSMDFAIRLQDIFLFTLLLTLGAMLFGVIAFVQPTVVELPSSSPYEHRGTFSYTAAVPASIYGSESLKSGEPLFRRITNSFELTFDYQLSGKELSELQGLYRIDAIISSNNGWSRVVELQAQQSFSGNKLRVQTEIDIAQLQTYVDIFAEETGIVPNQYDVDIVPSVALSGMHKAEEWSDVFTPLLSFRVSELQVQLLDDGIALEDKLSQSLEGTLFDTVLVDNTLGFFGLNLNIHTARLSAIVLSALFAGLSIALGLRIAYLNRQPEATRIQGLYQRLILPVSGVEADPGKRLVEVLSFEHLLRIAQQEGVSVLLEEGSRNLHFFVQGAAATYHTQVRK